MNNLNYQKIIQSQLDWLSSLINNDGVFVMHPKPSNKLYKIVPYFSNISCLGLLTNKNYLEKVKLYLKWYIGHLNFPDKYGADGTVYDYYMNLCNDLISSNDYDSYDSYPATFLSLCSEYYKLSQDKAYFLVNKRYVYLILNSLFSTMDDDFLTWAKPNWKIKYLMDNSEVYKGLIDSKILFEQVYNDKIMYDKITNLSKKIKESILNKMKINNYKYYYQIDKNNKGSAPNFKLWYPDTTSQLFLILNGVVESDSVNAGNIYNNFLKNHPDWHKNIPKSGFPDMAVCYVALIMNDKARVIEYVDICLKKFSDYQWPWFNVESSYIIRILSELA